MKLEEAQKLVGKKAKYWNNEGTIESVWDLQNYMTLAKVKCGDSSYMIVNIDILHVTE
jgi:hypothetical protein